ncbi:MAG: hypothetical protein JXR96_00105 [Deltaproteobacteria bacterium]|nr:hypothetical protein [Deltaproteobacteria bacterium]
MASMLAIVSRPVFEKEATDESGLLGIGGVYRTGCYRGRNKRLEALGKGDALFLVTVRPPGEQLWLVAVLESPEPTGEGWQAKENQTPICDISHLLQELKLDTGKGVAAKPGRLAMSLQTPRKLAASDVRLLRAASGSLRLKSEKKSGYAFTNPRKPRSPEELAPHLQRQLRALGEIHGRASIEEQLPFLELWDVTGPRGEVELEAWFYLVDSGSLFMAGSTEEVGKVIQSCFECQDEDLARELGKAAGALPEGELGAPRGVEWVGGEPEDGKRAPAARAEEIDWKALDHAQGSARGVPSQVEKLARGGGQKRADAFFSLHGSLVGQNAWFGASAPAAAALLEALSGAKEPDLILVLVADIIGADHTRAWLSPKAGPLAAQAELARAAALARKDELVGLLEAKKPVVRAAVPILLSLLPELAQQTLPLLMRAAVEDRSDAVKASAMLGLARLGEPGSRAEALLEAQRRSESRLVSGAASLGLLRLVPGRPFADEAPGIQRWLGWQAPRLWVDELLPWFGGHMSAWHQPLPAPARALVELARHRDRTEALLDLVLAAAETHTDGVFSSQAGKIVLELSELGARDADSVALVGELSAQERQIAEKLARTCLLPQGGHGLPAAGRPRRRWLGLEPPGPLDENVELELDGERKVLPVWYAWRACQRMQLFADDGDPLPVPIKDSLQGLDRYEAIADLNSGSYRSACRIDLERIEQEIAALAGEQGLVERMERLADEAGARLGAALREGARPTFDKTLGALILLPLIRAGRPLKAEWEQLIAFDEAPQVREILEALPAERREARISSYLAWDAGPATSYQIEHVLYVLDLAPSERIARALLQKIEKIAKKLPDRAEAYARRLRTLADKHPALGV